MGQARRRRDADRQAGQIGSPIPAAGLQGDHRGTCIACLRPTDTGLAFQGEAEWIFAGLLGLGVPEDQVHPALADLDPAGWGNGLVPVGKTAVTVRACAECASKPGFPVALLLPGHPVPAVQPA
ncbi:hypothetical protein FF36_05340 [Frankia torreyi]|uniref:Uncharacterized protein n=1 Tax=Frankia torreyi TaxID=1856 RepID=A0A0D8B862_9ACTN|nr:MULTISPECIES: hypothetical protein [Frankia]KJE20366.1 hypothetical protein FF36_05340 [Frankia torreyi]KQM02730.1 hypothetical protein FF86_105722 [Frankia sp. CpI1-P]